MMNVKPQGVAVVSLAAAVVAFAAGTAHADAGSPAPVDSPQAPFTTEVAPGIRFSDNVATGVSSLATPLGTVLMQGGHYSVLDAGGQTVVGTPITDTAAPATPGLPGTTNSASPSVVAPEIAAAAGVRPVAGGDLMSDLNQAVEAANPPMGAALAVGSTVGSVVGAIIGCPFGMATGGTLTSLISVGTLTVPAMAAACLVGAVTFGGFGAVVGGVGLAIPVGIAAGVQKFNQLQAQHSANESAPHSPANS
ncbi:hypothetical protein [Nocardia sp. CA-120079]|uniref:hypothetical protein n=1 Tax=Nocardia sp. CA-120079 TaxID=3239974 RepID=UPI003D96FE04